jgi:hypothetical protein
VPVLELNLALVRLQQQAAPSSEEKLVSNHGRYTAIFFARVPDEMLVPKT